MSEEAPATSSAKAKAAAPLSLSQCPNPVTASRPSLAGLHSISTASVASMKRKKSIAVARDDIAAAFFPKGAPKKERKLKPELYDQFNTVSWRKEVQKDALHTTALFTKKPGRLTLMWFEISSWFLPGLVGFLTACSGSAIEVFVEVMADWRFGFCVDEWKKNLEHCCALHHCVESHEYPSAWRSWSSLLGFSRGSSSWACDYCVYALCGLCYCVTAAFLVRYFAPTARGSGIPEVKTILGGFCMADVLSCKTLFIKIIGLCFVVSSGMSLGKEGPLVHVACCWATMCAYLHDRYLENEAKRRELLSAAAAAGVSVAFGSPLGGVLFSLEEVSTFFPQKTMWRAFFAAVIAALTLQWLNPTGTGKLTMFEVKYTAPLAIVEYVPFTILGAIGGCIGALFVALNVRISTFRMKPEYKAKVPIIAEVALIGAFTFISSYPFTFLRPLCSDIIHKMFSDCSEDNELCSGGHPIMGSDILIAMGVAAVIRFVQTVFTFGTGVPAGLFVPSLYIGACLGRVTGSILAMVDNHYYKFTPENYAIQPGVYAMVGAASVLGGVCRVTISLVVIMFELTGALEYIVPFMLAVLMSKWVGDFFTLGIYDCHIVLRGYPYLHEPEEITYSARACDVMEDELEVIHVQKNTVGSLLDQIQDVPFYGFPLVRSETDLILLGFVVREELQEFLQEKLKETFVSTKTVCFFSMHSPKYILDACSGKAVDLSPLVDDTVMRLVPETPLSQVHNVFRQLGLRMIMVVRHGRLQGMVTKKNFVHHLHTGAVGNITADPAMFDKSPDSKARRRFSVNELLPETDLMEPLLAGRRAPGGSVAPNRFISSVI